MRLVIQRVSEASLIADGEDRGIMLQGLVVLIGIEEADTEEDVFWLSNKLVNMRIFGDEEGQMNLSLLDIHGSLMLVSQFTLHASTQKGNRPGFIKAARPEQAIPLYDSFIKTCTSLSSTSILTGVFGAHMKISLVNDGPVTIIIDSKARG